MSTHRRSAASRTPSRRRTAPGTCYRLWPEPGHRLLPRYPTPEIREADLAPLALELARWGSGDPNALAWLDPPPAAAYAQARALLAELGALDGTGRITAH